MHGVALDSYCEQCSHKYRRDVCGCTMRSNILKLLVLYFSLDIQTRTEKLFVTTAHLLHVTASAGLR